MSESSAAAYANSPADPRQGLVDDVFTSVARRYDVMNDIMSGGLHRLWKDALVNALNPPKRGRPFRLIDVAGGTGDIALRVADRSAGHADIVVADVNEAMLAIGRERAAARGLEKIAFRIANGEALPFADGSFDAYTIAFGIRNVPRVELALAEAHRVLRFGGRFLCLEFAEVDVPVVDRLYDAYSFNAIPRIGGVVAGDAEAYRYLVESIRAFPNQERFADLVRGAGLRRVSYRNFSAGVAALYSGWKL
jgi:demethylmenaquinone methyltransferase/2-methoxy-6-polyprenyl-1,4-benzoquinol methylase